MSTNYNSVDSQELNYNPMTVIYLLVFQENWYCYFYVWQYYCDRVSKRALIFYKSILKYLQL